MNATTLLSTVDPISPPSADTSVEPEWGRVSYISKRFQIGRTHVFRNIRLGNWKTVLLRDKGKKSGIRLVYIPSVREHLSRLAKEQNAS